jgi:hypothetical protein
LTFWQTVGLFILSKILLTGVAPGSRHNHRRDWRKKCDEKYRNAETKGPDIATADQA